MKIIYVQVEEYFTNRSIIFWNDDSQKKKLPNTQVFLLTKAFGNFR